MTAKEGFLAALEMTGVVCSEEIWRNSMGAGAARIPT